MSFDSKQLNNTTYSLTVTTLFYVHFRPTRPQQRFEFSLQINVLGRPHGQLQRVRRQHAQVGVRLRKVLGPLGAIAELEPRDHCVRHAVAGPSGRDLRI